MEGGGGRGGEGGGGGRVSTYTANNASSRNTRAFLDGSPTCSTVCTMYMMNTYMYMMCICVSGDRGPSPSTAPVSMNAHSVREESRAR